MSRPESYLIHTVAGIGKASEMGGPGIVGGYSVLTGHVGRTTASSRVAAAYGLVPWDQPEGS